MPNHDHSNPTSPPYTEAKARRWIKRMRMLKFTGADFVEWMADQIWPRG